MARYWVGGTGTWNSTNTANWSASSGGAGGASVPSGSDDVIFDANSGTGTVTVSSGTEMTCRTLDMTNYLGTFAGIGDILIGGGSTACYIKIGAAITYTHNGFLILNTANTGNTITTNGKTISSTLWASGVTGGDWTLQDDFNTTGKISLADSGTFSTNGKNVSAASIAFDNGGTDCTGSTITITAIHGGTAWNGTAITAAPLFIKLTSETYTPNFRGAGKTYNNIEFSGQVLIEDSNTFATLTLDAGSVTTLLSGITLTISALVSNGSVGNLATLNASTAGTPATLACSNAISVDYMSIQDSTASGHTPFYAGSHSTNVSGNTNWLFTNPPVSGTFNALLIGGD